MNEIDPNEPLSAMNRITTTNYDTNQIVTTLQNRIGGDYKVGAGFCADTCAAFKD